MMETKKLLCYARFLHACSGAPHMDLFINDKVIVQNFGYKDFTEYFSASPGIYHLSLCAAGKRDQTILDEQLEMDEHSINTIAASGTADRPHLSFIHDKKGLFHPDQSHIRFINLSPFHPSLHIFLNGSLSVPSLSYQEASDYIPVSPGTLSIKAQDIQTGQTVLFDHRMNMDHGKIYGAYLMGADSNMNILVSPEGVCHLEF